MRRYPAAVTVVALAAATSVWVIMFPFGVPETDTAESETACASNGIANGNEPVASVESDATYTGVLAIAGSLLEVFTGLPATRAFSLISSRAPSGEIEPAILLCFSD